MKNNFTKYACLLALGLLGAGSGAFAQAPANDDCSGALGLAIGTTCTPVNATTTDATGSTGMPDPDCGAAGTGWDDDVWFTFTPQAGQASVNIAFTSVSGNDDMAAQIYTSDDNSCAGIFSRFACSDDDGPGLMPGFSYLAVSPGTTYYMRVYTFDSSEAGDFTVCVAIPPTPPANDECSSAIAVTPSTTYFCAAPFVGTGLNATMSTDVPSCGSTPTSDVWYSFIASDTSQNISFTGITPSDAAATTFSYGAAVYGGTCGALIPLDCGTGDGGSDIQMNLTGLTSGGTYYLQVFGDDSYDDNSDPVITGIDFSLCIAIPPPATVTNDLPADAITVVVDQPCTAPYFNNGATAATGEPGAACSGVAENYGTVWFKFAAPAAGAVRITTDFSGYTLTDTRVALFSVGSATNFATFESLACDEDNGIIGSGFNSILYATGLTANTEYYIVVDQYGSGTTQGTFCLEVSTLTDAMLPVAASCNTGQDISGYDGYAGWMSLVDEEGKLIANVRPAATSGVDQYNLEPSLSIHQGAPRQDANGLVYLDRNSFYDGSMEDAGGIDLPTADMDLQLFFTQTELGALGSSLSNLNVTHIPGSSCSEDAAGDGSQTALLASGSGTSGNVSWIDITTPGFSNFFLMNGTTPLPIDLRSIVAVNTGSSNRVDWSTAKEDKGEYFELERSTDSKRFAFLARINGKGAASEYSYTDRSPLGGTNYYRLKMINNDGKISYSKVVQAIMNGKGAFRFVASPNPVQHTVTVSLKGDRAGNATLVLSDVTGKALRTYTVSGKEIGIDMSGLSQGIYLLRYTDDSHKETMKISKQ
ncbi:T9SS type A sorting domain-containing protein [Taibaiella koreensis]|uniref:T9SS type A sorting domain-containing protein n=1 Tax=Taibaiella koreensis TaxID=1268548 RepID=UPI000E59BE42|nr:T9SS type A sorting domain-containing protein [Taibaiella koreensis]